MADRGTKYVNGDDVQRLSEWTHLIDGGKMEQDKENTLTESKAIAALFVALPNNRTCVIVRSILTVASVASVRANEDIAVKNCEVHEHHDKAEMRWNEMSESNRRWVSLLIFTVLAIFAAVVAIGGVTMCDGKRSRIRQDSGHNGKVPANEPDKTWEAKGSMEEVENSECGTFGQQTNTTQFSRLMGARAWKRAHHVQGLCTAGENNLDRISCNGDRETVTSLMKC